MKAHIFEGKDGQWYWHIKARNGEIVAQGEGYSRRASARRGLLGFLNGIRCVVVPV